MAVPRGRLAGGPYSDDNDDDRPTTMLMTRCHYSARGMIMTIVIATTRSKGTPTIRRDT